MKMLLMENTYTLSYSFKNKVTANCIILCLLRKGYLLIPVSTICIPNAISAIDVLPLWKFCKID